MAGQDSDLAGGVFTRQPRGSPPPLSSDRHPGAEGLGAKSKEMDWPSAVGGG